jgi:hypothetical protein
MYIRLHQAGCFPRVTQALYGINSHTRKVVRSLAQYGSTERIKFIVKQSKIPPKTGHEGPEGELKYSSTLSLTLALDEGGWSTPRPGRFTPRKETRYPLYRRLGGPQAGSGRVRKISPPPEFDPRTVQPVASRYTDYAIPAHNFRLGQIEIKLSGYQAGQVVESRIN